MKKRFFSLLIAAAMLASLAPVSFAKNVRDISTDGESIAAVSDSAQITGMDLLGETAAVEAEEEDNLISEDEADVNNEQNEREDVIVENPMRNPDGSLFYESNEQAADDSVELMATNSYTIKGTVSLPSGVSIKEDMTIGVYAYKPVLDGNIILEKYPSSAAYTKVTLSAGKTSVSYTLSVNSGDYIVGARLLEGNKDVLSQIIYYSSDGSTNSRYEADEISVSSNVSGKNISLLKAARSITGTIDLGKAVTSDTSIYLSANDSNTYNLLNNSYIYPVVKAGESKVSYEIGVEQGSYGLYVDCDNSYGYFDGEKITDSYENKLILNTNKKSYSDMNMKFSIKSDNKTSINYTLQFNNAFPEDKRYCVILYDDNGSGETSQWITVPAGNKSYQGSLNYDSSLYSNIYIGYTDITGSGSVSYDTVNKYFYSSEYGIVGDFSMAEAIPVNTPSVVLSEPACYSMSGNITVSSSSKLDRYVYVMANMNNGETFYSRVRINGGETSASYSVNIPQRLKGEEFTVSYGMSNGSRVGDEKNLDEKYTLNGNISNVNITFSGIGSGDAVDAKGTVSFSTAAPEGGMTVNIRDYYNYDNSVLYYVPAGTTSMEYSLDEVSDDDGTYMIYAYIESGCPTSMVNTVYGELSSEDVSDNSAVIDLTFGTTVKVTGRISIPSGVSLTNYVSFSVYGYDDYNEMSCRSYYTISPGETYADYTVYLPKDGNLDILKVSYINDVSDTLYDEDMYYSEDGETIDYTTLDLELSNSISGMNFTLWECVSVSGTLSMPEDGYLNSPPGSQSSTYIYVYAASTDLDVVLSSDVKIAAETTDYKIKIPKKYSGDYYIYYSISSYMDYDTNLATGVNVYYSANGTVFDRNEADIINTNDSVSDVDFIFAKGIMISGIITVPDDAYINGGDLRCSVYAKNIDSGKSYRKTYKINSQSPKNMVYSIVVSPADIGNYNIYYFIDKYETTTNLVDSETYYYSANGMVRENGDTVAVNEDVSGLNITLQTGYIISGLVQMPEGGYTNDSLSTYIYAVTESGSSFSTNTAYLTGSDVSYSICIPKDLNENYYIKFYAYTSGKDTNLLNTTMYYSENGSVKTSSEATKFTPDSDNTGINLVLPIGRLLSGKLIMPDDAFINDSITGITLYIDSTSYLARVNEDYSFTCSVSDDITGSHYVRILWDKGIDGNIIAQNYYYNQNGVSNDSSTADMVEFTTEEDISGIDIHLETGYYIAGELVLPRNVHIDGSENYTIGIAGTSYKTTIYLYDSEKCTYNLVVPKTLEDIKVYAKATYSWDEDDILDRTSTAYYNSEGTVYNEDEAEIISFTNSKAENIDITVPILKAKISITANAPENYEGVIGYTLYAEFDSGNIYEYTDVLNYWDIQYNTIQIPAAETSDNFRLYYELDSYETTNYDDLVPQRMYINKDGTLTIEKSRAEKYAVGKYNLEITFADYDSFDEQYLFESEHPYEAGNTKTYTYNYPEDVTSMYVRFSDNCGLSEGDVIEIYDADDNKIGEDYLLNELAGEVVKIDGKAFKVTLKSQSDKGEFGFAVTDIITDKFIEDKVSVASFPVNQNGDIITDENISLTQSVSFNVVSGIEEERDVTIIVAAYNNDRLCGITATNTTINTETSEINDLPCDVNDAYSDSIKIFIWNGIDGMYPLMDAYKCN